MYKRNKDRAVIRECNGLKCHILLHENDVRGDRLAVTWCDLEPGVRQQPHRHVPEQVYVIVQGSGVVSIGEKESQVQRGDLVYIPSNMLHSIVNTGDSVLTYVSAATPGFDVKAFVDQGECVEETAPVNQA